MIHDRKFITGNKPVTEIIRERFSCREYVDRPIAAETQEQLQAFCESLDAGPLNIPVRFRLLAAGEEGRAEIRGLGTYGCIKNPSGFLVGAVASGARDQEAYGCMLESLILGATSLGLGTCWLGGSFTRSSFGHKICLGPGERLPAVAAVGYIPDIDDARQAYQRRRVMADKRLPWDCLFFERRFGSTLSRETAGPYAVPLEMVRLGPSAHNKQPWRVVVDGAAWHFYLQRTPDAIVNLGEVFLKVEDLQRVEMGIAMCHFELAARELGLDGHWEVKEPVLEKTVRTEYTVSWVEKKV